MKLNIGKGHPDEECSTVACGRPVTIAGTFHQDGQDYRVAYCTECVAWRECDCTDAIACRVGACQPATPATEAVDEADRLRAVVEQVKRLCGHVEDGWLPSSPRLVAALRRVLNGEAGR